MATVWGSQGATLSVDLTGANSNGNGTYTLVNNITSMSGMGGGETGKRDTTVLASTVKTYSPTIPDPGEASFDFWPDPTDNTHRTIRDWIYAPQAFAYWKLLPNTTNVNSNTNSSVIFQAFPTNFDGMNFDDVDANIAGTLTLQKTGAPTFNPA